LKAKKALDLFRSKKLLVVHIQHIADSDKATFFLPNTEGALIREIVKPLPEERVFIKHKVNSFENTGLQEYLASKGIKKLIVCGMQSNVCVEKGSLHAATNGYTVSVLEDAIAAVDLNAHNGAIERLKAGGVEIVKTDNYTKTVR
jgi:nicotinamidase-related amidase